MNATPQARTETLQVRLRPDEADRLRALAAQEDEPVSLIVRRLIRRHLEQQEASDGTS
jgi:predicted DNA-binding protein